MEISAHAIALEAGVNPGTVSGLVSGAHLRVYRHTLVVAILAVDHRPHPAQTRVLSLGATTGPENSRCVADARRLGDHARAAGRPRQRLGGPPPRAAELLAEEILARQGWSLTGRWVRAHEVVVASVIRTEQSRSRGHRCVLFPRQQYHDTGGKTRCRSARRIEGDTRRTGLKSAGGSGLTVRRGAASAAGSVAAERTSVPLQSYHGAPTVMANVTTPAAPPWS